MINTPSAKWMQRNLATFASEAMGGCLFELMPVEERVYFIRKKDAGSDK
jgi:hypothetical protein